MSEKQIASNHRGVLFIVNSIIRELVPEINIEGVDTNGQLRDAGAFARLKEKLLLPESYAIVAIVSQHFGREWGILVESPELPSANEMSWEAIEYPHIEPIYCQVFNEETDKYEPHLVEIKVHAQRTIPIKGGFDWLLRADSDQYRARETLNKVQEVASASLSKSSRESVHNRTFMMGMALSEIVTLCDKRLGTDDGKASEAHAREE